MQEVYWVDHNGLTLAPNISVTSPPYFILIIS